MYLAPRIILVSAIAHGLTATPATAGAWPEARGAAEAIAAVRTSGSHEAFDTSGRSAPAENFRRTDGDLYLRYGVTNDLTLIGHVVYAQLRSDSPGTDLDGFDATELGLMRRLWSGERSVVSAQASVLTGGSSALTSGGTDFELRSLYGVTFQFWDRPAYLNAEIGYRWRDNDFADQLRPDLTLGWHASDRVLVLAQSFNVFTTTSGVTEIFEGEQQKAQLSIVYRGNDSTRFQIGGYTTYDGRATPAERGVVAAVWRRF